jgi:hypothetical protein
LWFPSFSLYSYPRPYRFPIPCMSDSRNSPYLRPPPHPPTVSMPHRRLACFPRYHLRCRCAARRYSVPASAASAAARATAQRGRQPRPGHRAACRRHCQRCHRCSSGAAPHARVVHRRHHHGGAEARRAAAHPNDKVRNPSRLPDPYPSTHMHIAYDAAASRRDLSCLTAVFHLVRSRVVRFVLPPGKLGGPVDPFKFATSSSGLPTPQSPRPRIVQCRCCDSLGAWHHRYLGAAAVHTVSLAPRPFNAL